MEDIRPTAKWANRMLRPLTSIYHRLEKHHKIVTSVSISKPKDKPDVRPDSEKTRVLSLGRAGARVEESCNYPDDEEPNDPAWIPGKPEKRRLRHNYSSRGQRNGARRRSRLSMLSPEMQKTLPGAIEIATPLITGKARGVLEESSPSLSSLRRQLFQNTTACVDNAESGEHRRPTRTNNSSFPPYQGSWKEVLDQSRDPGFVDIALLLDRVFLKFLRSTRVNRQDVEGERGTRSLLSMTVRRLPEFIVEEQKIQDELDDGCNLDMCDAYFTELEASYAPSGNGWQPLREACRARGIYFIADLIQNEWITDLATCRLLEECLSQKEFDALEALLSKRLSRVNKYCYPTTFDAPRTPGNFADPVHVLANYYIRSTARRSYVFEEITKLLVRGALPAEWMVTALWKRCVDGAIKSLSTDDGDSAAATRLLEAVILSSTGVYSSSDSTDAGLRSVPPLRPMLPRDARAPGTQLPGVSEDQYLCPVPIQDALSNLNASLITALCGMCITRSRAAGDHEKIAGAKIRDMVSHLAFAVQRAISIEPQITDSNGPTFQQLRRGYGLLADCILYCGETISTEVIYYSEPVSRQSVELFFRALAAQPELVKNLAEFAVQVFHYSSHGNNHSPTRTPWEIRNKVSQLTQLTSNVGVSLFLGKISAETAMELAEKSLDPDDHAWATNIQEEVASSQREQSPGQSPSTGNRYPSDQNRLYRWEEAIGEWVASTPAARPRAANLDIVVKNRVTRRGLSRTIACLTSSSSPSSVRSKETISSVTSSAPSVPGKRACTSQASSPRPYKKIRHTRSRDLLAGKESDSWKVSGQLQFQSSPESAHAPVAARTRTALRGLLHAKCATGQVNLSSPNTTGPVSRKIEVVIVNKRSNQGSLKRPIFQNSDLEAVSSRLRRSSFRTKADIKLPPKHSSRQGAAQILRRRTVIPCLQDDDSDDELSFL